MNKHTPAPWLSRKDKGNSGDFGILNTNGDVIAEAFADIRYAGEKSNDAKHNARLIAAAPDLLAALHGVVRVADRATVEFDAARAAIAKATMEDA